MAVGRMAGVGERWQIGPPGEHAVFVPLDAFWTNFILWGLFVAFTLILLDILVQESKK
jgi:hypothetical protein